MGKTSKTVGMLLGTVLIGCSYHREVRLVHPETGERVVCAFEGRPAWYAQQLADTCARDMVLAGYVRETATQPAASPKPAPPP